MTKKELLDIFTHFDDDANINICTTRKGICYTEFHYYDIINVREDEEGDAEIVISRR